MELTLDNKFYVPKLAPKGNLTAIDSLRKSDASTLQLFQPVTTDLGKAFLLMPQFMVIAVIREDCWKPGERIGFTPDLHLLELGLLIQPQWWRREVDRLHVGICNMANWGIKLWSGQALGECPDPVAMCSIVGCGIPLTTCSGCNKPYCIRCYERQLRNTTHCGCR